MRNKIKVAFVLSLLGITFYTVKFKLLAESFPDEKCPHFSCNQGFDLYRKDKMDKEREKSIKLKKRLLQNALNKKVDGKYKENHQQEVDYIQNRKAGIER